MQPCAGLYLYVELSHVNRDLNATADQNTVQAITQHLDKMQDQMDGFASGKPVQDADFRASKQALSQRIDTAQAKLVEIQRANQHALQGMAQEGDLVVLEAKLKGLQNDLGECRRLARRLLLPGIHAMATSGPGLLRRSLVGHGHAAGLFFMGQFSLFTDVRPFLETVNGFGVINLSLTLLALGLAGFIGTLLIGGLIRRGLYTTLTVIPLLMAVLGVVMVVCGSSAPLVLGLLSL